MNIQFVHVVISAVALTLLEVSAEDFLFISLSLSLSLICVCSIARTGY